MRYVIYGAGAIGGAIGARLYAAGRDVVLIARGSHLAALQQEGLRLKSPEGEFVYQIEAAGHPSELDFGTGDVVILAMKTQDAAAALIDLEAAAGNEIPVFCTQNGVETERLAARRFDNVYGMITLLLATFTEPGVVQTWSGPIAGILDAGRYPSGIDETLLAVAADLRASNLACEPLPDLMRWKYAKMVSILSNSLEAVSGRQDAADVVRAMQDEAEMVLRTAGIDFVASEELTARRRRETNIKSGTRPGASVWQSLARGAGAVEADYLNGEISLLARTHGVTAPLNEAVRRLANRAAAERLPPGSIPLSEVIALWETLGAKRR